MGIHFESADNDGVPIELAIGLRGALTDESHEVKLYECEGAVHNVSCPYLAQAILRAIEFFGNIVI